MEKTSVYKHRIKTRIEKIDNLLLFLAADIYEEKEPEKALAIRKCKKLTDEISKILGQIKED